MRFYFQFVLILGLSVSNAFAEAETKEDYRAKIRDWVISHAHHQLLAPAIAPMENDLATDLVDELRYTSLADMENAGLLSARLPDAPWSSSYWPVYVGQIAYRYADPNFPAALSWEDNEQYLDSMIGRGADKELSPAEKYDLLVGDSAFTLTKMNIEAGAPYADRGGNVPTWFGICHGWAPASFMEKRPVHSVKAKAADGRVIQFFPADLKALASLLWANGAGETRFIGSRCNNENPGHDGHGRVTDPDCFGTNPATWHISVVNQIGVAKRSFVADVSANTEVWNQPALGYYYSYVNPISGVGSTKLEEAKVKLADWAADPFKDTRSPDAVSVVNVVMRFEYGVETQPSPVAADGPESDAHGRQTYSYDLELDAQDKIVGGEWHTGNHPGFLWTVARGSHATSVGDAELDRRGDQSGWEIGESMPRSWLVAARTSAENDQPLARIVEQLLEAAQ